MKTPTTILALVLLLGATAARAETALERCAAASVERAEAAMGRCREKRVSGKYSLRPHVAAAAALVRELPRAARRAALAERLNLVVMEAALVNTTRTPDERLLRASGGVFTLEEARELVDLGYLPAAPRPAVRDAFVAVYEACWTRRDRLPAAARAVEELGRKPRAGPYAPVLAAALATRRAPIEPSAGIVAVILDDGAPPATGAATASDETAWEPEVYAEARHGDSRDGGVDAVFREGEGVHLVAWAYNTKARSFGEAWLTDSRGKSTPVSFHGETVYLAPGLYDLHAAFRLDDGREYRTTTTFMIRSR